MTSESESGASHSEPQKIALTAGTAEPAAGAADPDAAAPAPDSAAPAPDPSAAPDPATRAPAPASPDPDPAAASTPPLSASETHEREPAVLRLARRLPKRVVAVLASAAVLVGIVLIARPTTALDVLALLIGAGLVLGGLLELLVPAAGGDRLRMLLSAALVLTGAVVLVLPNLTVRAVAIVVGVTLIVRGAVGVSAIVLGRAHPLDRRVAEVLLGAAAIAFGILAIVWPDITLLVVAVVFGASLTVVGAAALLRMLRARRPRDRRHRRDTVARRWMRTIAAVCAVVLAAGAVVASITLREGTPVVDDFYAAPRSVPGEPGELIRAEPFTRGVPAGAVAWRILYTTTHGDDSPAVASGIVVAPDDGQDHPAIAWHHGTTGFDRSCAPSLATDPFGSGAMFVLDRILEQGWALVATDYIGLGTEGPHPYLIGEGSARAELDAVRAARALDAAGITDQTVAWGHSQGGGATLWSAAIAEHYAPDVPLSGTVALAPASDLAGLVERLPEVTGGSVFASFVISAYSEIYDDVPFSRYIRPGADVTVREMATRCLAAPDMLVSVLTVMALTDDPSILAADPITGALGERLTQNIPPASDGVPVLLGQGVDDQLIAYDMQSAYAQRLCGEGATVDYRGYGGRDHLSLVETDSPAIEEAMAWTRDRLAGVATAGSC
ncbi:lipase family protein [Microbacterium sp. NPDC058345]|uniref:lipase family protein n=1 Tax=Microbacterium sp. NPDC058345 TaxID=3346455 RepID=UPI003646FC26